MRILYADCFGGVSGDMLLAGMADLGVDFFPLERDVQKAGFPCSFHIQESFLNDLPGKQVWVKAPEGSWNISRLGFLNKVKVLSPKGKEKCKEVLQRILEVEKEVHKTEKPHLHELGEWDTVADVVGFIYGLEYLKVEELWFSSIPVGEGTIKLKEGEYPNPVPAVISLAKNYMVERRRTKAEISTPTGVLLLTTLGKQELEPTLILEKVGTGFGHRQEPTNGLRLWLGRKAEKKEEVVELQTVVDDITPEVASGVIELLLQKGALDVYIQPAWMKKGRSGFLFTLLCPEEKVSPLLEELFLQTGTLGIRYRKISRWVLQRKIVEVDTPYGKIPVKVAYYKGKEIGAKPELEVCLEKAKEKNIALQKVISEAVRAYKNPSRT
ncbi:MAG: nickel pincer cofactor biosynthesis protein LarC2 [bacterium JZ-2024 1]